LGQSADGLGWIGSHKMDPWTTLGFLSGSPREETKKTGNKSVPIRLAQCCFPELAISNAKI